MYTNSNKERTHWCSSTPQLRPATTSQDQELPACKENVRIRKEAICSELYGSPNGSKTRGLAAPKLWQQLELMAGSQHGRGHAQVLWGVGGEADFWGVPLKPTNTKEDKLSEFDKKYGPRFKGKSEGN